MKKSLMILSLAGVMAFGAAAAVANANALPLHASGDYVAIGTHDEAANVAAVSAGGQFGSKRLDRKAFSVNLNGGYGTRVSSILTYDVSNFSLSLDLEDVEVGSVGVISFGTADCYPVAGGGAFLSMDLYKTEAGKIHTTLNLGSTGAGHNSSMTGWGTTDVNTYIGQTIALTTGGDWNLSILKGETNTTVTVNDFTATIANSVIWAGTSSTAGAYVSYGNIGNAAFPFVVNDVYDAAETEYRTTGTFGQMYALLDEMATYYDWNNSINETLFNKFFVTDYFGHTGMLGHAIALADYVHGFDKTWATNNEIATLNAKKALGSVADIAHDYTALPEVGTHDVNANFSGFTASGAYGSKRISSNSMLLNVNCGWGNRASIIESYDFSDFDGSVNLNSIATNQVLMIMVGEADCYPTAGAAITMDVWKITDTTALVTFANASMGHNTAINGLNADNYSGYSGTIITLTSDGDFNFAIKKTDATNTVVTYQDKKFDVATSDVYANFGDNLVRQVVFGGLNNNGVTDATATFIVNHLLDAAESTYLTSLDTNVATLKAAFKTAYEKAMAVGGEGALTDDNVEAFKTAAAEAVAAMVNDGSLHDYDFAYYLSEVADGYIKAMNDKIANYSTDLVAAKVAAAIELEAYAVPADYRDEEASKLAAIISKAEDDFETATTLGGVKTILAKAKADIDALKTKAEYEAEEALAKAKSDAKSTLSAYLNLDDYSEAGIASIQSILADAKTAIDACLTIDDVNAKVTEYKAKLDEVPTEAEETAAALAAAKTSAKAALDSYVADLTKYSTENQSKIASIISKAKTAIDAATTVEAVNTLLAKAKSDIDAIPLGTTSSSSSSSSSASSSASSTSSTSSTSSSSSSTSTGGNGGGCGGAIASTAAVGVIALLGVLGIAIRRHKKVD